LSVPGRPISVIQKKLLEKGNYSKYIIKAGLTGYFQAEKAKKFRFTEEEMDKAYIDFCKNNSAEHRFK